MTHLLQQVLLRIRSLNTGRSRVAGRSGLPRESQNPDRSTVDILGSSKQQAWYNFDLEKQTELLPKLVPTFPREKSLSVDLYVSLCLFALFLCVFLSVCVCYFVSLCMYPCVSVCISVCLCLSHCMSMCVSNAAVTLTGDNQGHCPW